MTKTMASTYEMRRTAERPPARQNRTVRLFAVDVFLFALFVVVMNVPLTGLAIHEWLGIAIAVGVIVHILQHANWVVTTTRRMMSATSLQNRINYLLVVGSFIGFTSIVASGLLISEVALPWIGMTPRVQPFWLWLHLASVGWVIWLMVIHLAVNWRWIASASDRLIFKRFARSGNAR